MTNLAQINTMFHRPLPTHVGHGQTRYLWVTTSAVVRAWEHHHGLSWFSWSLILVGRNSECTVIYQYQQFFVGMMITMNWLAGCFQRCTPKVHAFHDFPTPNDHFWELANRANELGRLELETAPMLFDDYPKWVDIWKVSNPLLGD